MALLSISDLTDYFLGQQYRVYSCNNEERFLLLFNFIFWLPSFHVFHRHRHPSRSRRSVSQGYEDVCYLIMIYTSRHQNELPTRDRLNHTYYRALLISDGDTYTCFLCFLLFPTPSSRVSSTFVTSFILLAVSSVFDIKICLPPRAFVFHACTLLCTEDRTFLSPDCIDLISNLNFWKNKDGLNDVRIRN